MSRGAIPTSSVRRRRSDGEVTRRRVLQAAVESILESGYYHTSSNEIARRAGVTWGTIQHQFGSREMLLLEVLNDRWADLQQAVSTAKITGVSLEARLGEVLDVLATHYGRPEHLALLQILLDLTQNPTTSTETKKAAATHGRALSKAWQPLFSRALGDASNEADLIAYAFKALRGYLFGDVVAARISGRHPGRVERELLIHGVAASVRDEARSRGIDLE